MKLPNKPILKMSTNSKIYPTNEEYFTKIRTSVQFIIDKLEEGPSQKIEDAFFDYFTLLLSQAKNGDLAAQDYLGYAFKNGVGTLVQPNYDLSMSWLLLAGSNGNSLSLSRLKVFFTRSYDAILSLENIESILKNNYIDIDDIENQVGKLFCDGMVDELGIDADKLSSVKIEGQPATNLLIQKYENARNHSISRVIEYLTK